MLWRYLLLVLFGVLLFVPLKGQEKKNEQYTDSILALMHTAPQDTAKANLLFELSDYWSTKDSGRSAAYARQAIKWSQGYAFYTAKGYFNLAGAFFYFDQRKSKALYQKVIGLLKSDTSRKSYILKCRSWFNYGALIQRADGDTAFLKILIKHILPVAEKAKDTVRLALGYASMGMSFYNLYEYENAIPYFKRAVRLSESLHSSPKELPSYYYKLAKNYLFNKQPDSCKIYLNKCKRILSNASNKLDWAMYYKVLGRYYTDRNQFKQANRFLDSAMVIMNTMDWPYLKAGVLFQKYTALKEAKKYSQANHLLHKLYQDSLMMSKSGNKLTVLYNLAQMEANLGDMKEAYHWMIQYASFRDSVRREDTKSKVSELEIKYQSEKKQSKILSLQNKTQAQKIALQNKRFWNYALLAGLAILLLLCLLVFSLYRSKKQKAQREEEQHRQKLQRLKQEHQLTVYNAMLKGQEQERRRMAQDLHDGLGGMLAGVKLKLSNIASHQKKSQDMELYKVINQLDYSVQELRRIAHNMMPESLIRFGLETGLKDLCNSLGTESLNIDFQSYQLDKKIDQTVQISVYRIVQELVTNAVKHANANNILVQCSQNEQRLFITVEDDGQGFDVNGIEDNRGMGMSNLHKRIEFLHGKMDIDSKIGEGTVVNVEVNIHE